MKYIYSWKFLLIQILTPWYISKYLKYNLKDVIYKKSHKQILHIELIGTM